MKIFALSSVLVLCVAIGSRGEAAVVISAPSTVTETTAGMESRTQGPTAWICSALTDDSPWTAYGNIRGYLEGGNSETKDYSNLVLYPVMELFHTTKSSSRLCVYLPAEDHCYPPTPNEGQVKIVKQLTLRNYYDIRFWGQASNARVQYYKQKLSAALSTQNKAANLDLFFVSYFADHVREVRYDVAQPGRADRVQEQANRFCQVLTTQQRIGQVDYIGVNITESRLSFVDVKTQPFPQSYVSSCAVATAGEGMVAFSFVNNKCIGYKFGPSLCFCPPGSYMIYVNKATYESSGSSDLAPSKRTLVATGIEKLIINSEIAIEWMFPDLPEKTNDCKSTVNKSAPYAVGYEKNGKCYLNRIMDVSKCNQECRGQAHELLVPVSHPTAGYFVTLQSLCGQRVFAPIPDIPYLIFYTTGEGMGCRSPPALKPGENEDCVVTFERNQTRNLQFMFLGGGSKNKNCEHLQLEVYQGFTTNSTKLIGTACSGMTTTSIIETAMTVRFHRSRSFRADGNHTGYALLLFDR